MSRPQPLPLDTTTKYRQASAVRLSLLHHLATLCEEHADRRQRHPDDWGYVGDLDHVNEILTEAVRFMGGES